MNIQNLKPFFLLPVLLISFNCITTVKPEHVGLLWDANESKLTTIQPGRYFLFSPSKEIYMYSTRWENHIEKVDVITQDDLHIDVVASIIIRPLKSKVYYIHTEIGPQYYEKIVKAEFRTSIRNVMSNYQMIQISKKSPDIEEEIKDVISKRLSNKYLEVSDVNIDDINFSAKILNAIEEKLTRQQQLEAMKFEQKIAEKNEEIAKMKAKTEAETNRIKAENEIQISKIRAQTESENEVIRAESRAKSQKMINTQITPDYLKLKALESHYKAFESPNSKVIFIPVGKDGLPMYININDKLLSNEDASNPKEKKKLLQNEEPTE